MKNFIYILKEWGWDEWGEYGSTIVGVTTDVRRATDWLIDEDILHRSVEKWIDGGEKLYEFNGDELDKSNFH